MEFHGEWFQYESIFDNQGRRGKGSSWEITQFSPSCPLALQISLASCSTHIFVQNSNVCMVCILLFWQNFIQTPEMIAAFPVLWVVFYSDQNLIFKADHRVYEMNDLHLCVCVCLKDQANRVYPRPQWGFVLKAADLFFQFLGIRIWKSDQCAKSATSIHPYPCSYLPLFFV